MYLKLYNVIFYKCINSLSSYPIDSLSWERLKAEGEGDDRG